jgi:hypothetical protein
MQTKGQSSSNEKYHTLGPRNSLSQHPISFEYRVLVRLSLVGAVSSGIHQVQKPATQHQRLR